MSAAATLVGKQKKVLQRISFASIETYFGVTMP
jgi:hypothetical protein